MAVIGSFGGLTFSVSEKQIKTFDNMQWDMQAKYAEHDRHIKRDLLEFLGPGLEGVTFDMDFSVFIGTNPLKEILKLRKIIENGITDRLVIGGKVYGSYKWVMTKASNALKRFDNKGNMLSAKVTVTLKEYPKR